MKFVRSWLDEFVDTSARSAEALAADLESLGHEVESITPIPLENVVVGEITAIAKHPDADRLSVAQVDIGEKSIQLIFGQYFPVKVGDRLPVAVVPCSLPTGLVVEDRKIRGVQSEGMLAADGELGRNFTTEGILRFESDVKPGTPVADIVDWHETVFDLSLTPNRGDVFSLRGVARELAAKWQTKATLPGGHFSSVSGEVSENTQPLATIEDADLCPRYSARLIGNVQISHGPTVIAGRLGMIGHGHYNSIVDVTNYVMEEFGVPLHAFDAAKLSLPLVIRRAKTGETIELLNKQTYPLDDSMLVIADQIGPVALAGIMGGLTSAVTDQTKTVLLEAAYFAPTSIRRTRTKLNILSDSAYRFERGTDPAALEIASERATQLIIEDTEARAGALQIIGETPQSPTLPFAPEQIDAYLGTTIGGSQIAAILKGLHFTVHNSTVTPPSWRHDIAIWQDLAEEVARLIGYNDLPRTALPHLPMAETPDDRHWLEVEHLKDYLVSLGWTEHIGSSFLSLNDLKMLGIDTHAGDVIQLANPVSSEAAYLRCTLLVSLAKAIAKNPIFPKLKFFEIGTVWKPGVTEYGGEVTAITFMWTGVKEHELPAIDKPGISLSDTVARGFKIRRPVQSLESPLSVVLEKLALDSKKPLRQAETRPIRIPSRFQSTIRDIACIVPRTVSADALKKRLIRLENIVDVDLFDQFTSSKLGTDKHSLAFHLLLEHNDHSLTNQEIEETIQQATKIIVQEFKGEIR